MDANTAGMAVYERVAESIREDIRAGVLKPGDKLPGNRDLAEKYDVALGTAQKALRRLQDDGWLTATPAVGVFVNELPAETGRLDVAAELRELRQAVADLTERVQRIEEDTGES
ncbi:winged helix-turn-helix domain-containing protein [Amycolatopsis magusensis]|uniref:winged helix-turn-helix domain-containing protein n=1 Tax=Amycolatopsis magusensis TaxID=882444 RepID=UPI003C2E2043